MSISKARICIVDDDSLTLKVLDQLLQQAGHAVHSFQSVRQALEEIPSLQPDLILMDVHMQEMDGFEACHLLKENEQTKSIPLIFVTVMDQPQNIVRGFEVGATDYITKPVQKLELLARINTQLNIFHYQRQLEEKNQRLEKLLDLMQSLYQMSLEINRELNCSKIMESTLQHIIELFHAENGLAARYEPQEKNLTIALSVPSGRYKIGKTLQLGEGPLGMAAQKKETIIQEGAQLTAEGTLADNSPTSNAAVISIPLLSSSQLLGVMCIQTDGTKPFEFQDLYIAEMFAVQASAAMENARLLTEVQRLATTDDLTGLYNRRALMEIAQLEFERFLRYGFPLSVLMFDIDKFKKLNDQWGHLIGDEVLKELGKLCKLSLRNVDILGRYGGEEFIALLPQTALADAQHTAERLRSIIDNYPFYCRDQCLHITISIGVVEAQSQDKSLDALLDRVDQAMYRAKAAGRNTVST